MKKLLTVIFSTFLLSSLVNGQSISFQLNGKINQAALNKKKIILLTQVGNRADTVVIQDNKFSFQGTISESTNAAIVIDGVTLKFPLVNDQIQLVINDLSNKKFEITYQNSKIGDNLDSYFISEVKAFEKEFKALGSLEVNSKSNSVKMRLKLQMDSLAVSFLNSLKGKYTQTEYREGLQIIISDLIRLFGTKHHPDKIEMLFKLIPVELQNGYYGKIIKTYLNQSYDIALGEKVDFKFSDINNEVHQITDYRGKLILLEFWATWCGPCIAQLPSLKKINESQKIKIISVSIDEDIETWKRKVPDFGMNWINVHFKQNENLKDKFFINGVPYNILLSQEGKILRKNIELSELIVLLQ